jgi:ABC-2 type transport system ATP-binding protein
VVVAVTGSLPSDSPLIDVVGLGRDYADIAALDDLDLQVAAGTAVALVGHNGSGKTTALSLIAGRLDPTRGTVTIGGVDVHRPGGSEAVRAMVSFVPDAPALYPDLTVLDHLEIIGMAHGIERFDEPAGMLLERFGLEYRKHLLPRELSRGMRQKTQLACALLRPFSVIMLDEPVSGLDQGSRRELHAMLVEAKHEGAAVLLSTHQLDFAEGLADHLVVLSDGEVAAAGTYAEVVTSGLAADLGLA